LVAYALLGASWLVMRTDGRLQHRMRELGRPILAYTAWPYYVFRGKVKGGEGYH
jgi:cytochrome bd-type quinol oxidase subunit 2